VGGPPDPGRIEFAFPVELPGVRILRGEDSTHAWRVLNDVYAVSTPPHTAAEFRYRGRSHAFHPGAVGLWDPDEVFEITRMPFPERCRCLHIDPAVMTDAARDLGIRSPTVRFKHPLIQNRTLFRLALLLHQALENESSALERQELFAGCVQHLLEEMTEVSARRVRPGGEPRAVRRTREMLDARFSENVSLDELASASRLSRFHVLRTFAAAVGLPPHAYQNRLRVNSALKLLAAGMSLADVATEVGFADQSHLHRHFKRIVGVTPGAFARSDSARRRDVAATTSALGGPGSRGSPRSRPQRSLRP